MVDVSEQVSGLSELGTDLGGFMSELAPGVGTFVLLLGIFGGIAAIVAGIAYIVRNKLDV